MPEEDLGFEVAVAAAVHDGFFVSWRPIIERIISASAFHSGFHIAEFQTKQAVHAVEVGFLADEFDSDLRRFGFAFEQQGLLVDDVD